MGMIEIKNLTKSFYADHDALMNITHKTDGRPFIVIGEEDSGKTILLEVLAGLDKEYCGEVLIDGVERKGVGLDDVNISYITKDPVLFERKTVYENLEYVFKVKNQKYDKKEASKKIKEVAEELEIFDILTQKVKRLNLFQKRLVCVARARLKNSKIVLIDEPFFELYNFEKASLWQSILSVVNKLSSEVVVAEKGENLGYFVGCNVLRLEHGTKID